MSSPLSDVFAPLPAAWLGYKPGALPLMVRVCMDCPDKDTADALAAAQGLAITHTLCPRCYNVRTAALLGEVPD